MILLLFSISSSTGVSISLFPMLMGLPRFIAPTRRAICTAEAAQDKLGRIPSDMQPEGFGRGFDTDVEMHSPGNEQVALRGRFKMTTRSEANRNPKTMLLAPRSLAASQSTRLLIVMREGVGVEGIKLLQGSRAL